MLNRHNRLLVTFYVLSDALLGTVAFLAAYVLRFHSADREPDSDHQGRSAASSSTSISCRSSPCWFRSGFTCRGCTGCAAAARASTTSSRVFVGSILAVVFGIVATLYVETYFATAAARDRGAFQVSQVAWAIFLVLNVVLTFTSREVGARDASSAAGRRGSASSGF